MSKLMGFDVNVIARQMVGRGVGIGAKESWGGERQI